MKQTSHILNPGTDRYPRMAELIEQNRSSSCEAQINYDFARNTDKKARVDSSTRAYISSDNLVLNRQIHQLLEATQRFLPFQGAVTNIAGT